MLNVKNFVCSVLIAGSMLAASSASAAIDIRLPTAGDATGTVLGTYLDPVGAPRTALLLDGIPIAFLYDDTWSYSAPTLDALQSAGFIPASWGDYLFTTGVGTQDAVLFTQAGGIDNTSVGVGGLVSLEDPGPTLAGSATFIEATWGIGDVAEPPPAGDAGPNTVGEILDFLHSYDPDSNIPVFYADWNQTGGDASILLAVEVQVLDATDFAGGTLTEVAHWSLDTLDNGVFDRDGQALNFGQICFAPNASDCATGDVWVGAPTSGNTYSHLDHNVGSGAPDFIAYAETMDLSLFNADDIFSVHVVWGCEGDIGIDGGTLGCGNNGGEEIFLTGRISITDTPIPEPATLAMLGLGLAGLGFGRRRTAK